MGEEMNLIAKLFVQNLEPETLKKVCEELEQKTDGMDSDHPDVILTDTLLRKVRGE